MNFQNEPHGYEVECENLVKELERKITTEIILNETAEYCENRNLIEESLKFQLLKLDDNFSIHNNSQKIS